MNSLKVLDVTLRDGGCVNNFNFGQPYMEKILAAQEASGVDVIELGYLDENRGSEFGRTQYKNDKVIQHCILRQKKQGITYVVMMDLGKFNVEQLQPKSEDGIDGIRIAFHKADRQEIVSVGRKIMDKGYKLYIQPMTTIHYSDAELLGLVGLVNEKLADAEAFYIVDSFGEMRPNDMSRIINLVDHNLIPVMPLGFHSHNNLQMSYSNAISMLQFPTNRDLIIDCSIMGMGKGAGNLNTELLLDHLNMYYGKKYRIAPLLEVIDKVIKPLHAEFGWGYSVEYYLSSVNHCTPSYAGYFYGKHMLPIEQVGELLSLLPEEKKNSFDEQYAESLYREYNERNTVDDTDTVESLKAELQNKNILLLAPGKSLENFEVSKFTEKNACVVIGLNIIDTILDFSIITRVDYYEQAVMAGMNIITTSKMGVGGNHRTRVLDYKRWIDINEKTHDSSAVIAINLLKYCNVNKVYLAGSDGYSMDINENYMEATMRFSLTAEQVAERNQYYKSFYKNLKEKGMDIRFVTSSKYE